MKITDISVQANNKDRVNISVDGKYAFSLDIFQLSELGIKNGIDVTSEQITIWEAESTFGKLYGRALEYSMLRPHSSREIRDYLWKKTLSRKTKKRTGEVVDRQGVSRELADRVYARLEEKGYIDDEKFARWWVETRHQTKGISRRKLAAELQSKGVSRGIIDHTMQKSTREEKSELQKVIEKKRKKYNDDEQRFIAYLARQGFSYDDIRSALHDE